MLGTFRLGGGGGQAVCLYISDDVFSGAEVVIDTEHLLSSFGIGFGCESLWELCDFGVGSSPSCFCGYGLRGGVLVVLGGRVTIWIYHQSRGGLQDFPFLLSQFKGDFVLYGLLILPLGLFQEGCNRYCVVVGVIFVLDIVHPCLISWMDGSFC